MQNRCLLSLDVTTFPLGSPDDYTSAGDIATGADGNLWFTASSYEVGSNESRYFIGRMTPSGQLTRFPVQTPCDAITAGPDGNLWFTSSTDVSSRIGRITLQGQVTMFPIPSSPERLGGITRGPDGSVWFTMSTSDPDTWVTSGAIGKITPDGRITEYPLHEPIAAYGDSLEGITTGPDGNVWFTVTVGLGDPSGVGDSYREIGKIGRITPNGHISEFCLGKVPPTHSRQPNEDVSGSTHTSTETFKAIDITTGPDGALWFTESESLSPGGTGMAYSRFARAIGRIDVQGHVTTYTAPTRDVPFRIVTGPDRNLWYTTFSDLAWGGAVSYNSLGRFTPSGITTSFPVVPSGLEFFDRFADITTGPDGTLWASTTSAVVRIVPTTTTVGQMSLATDRGVWNDDHVTNNRHPAFEGTAQPGTVVRLLAQQPDGQGQMLIAQTVANGRGEWRAQARLMPDGVYSILATSRPPGRGHAFSTPELLYPFTDQVKHSAPQPDTSFLVIDTIAPRVTGLEFSAERREVRVRFQDRGGSGFFFWDYPFPGPTNPAGSEFVEAPYVSVKPPHTANELVWYVEPYLPQEPTSPTDPFTVTMLLTGDAPPPYLLRYFSVLGVYDVAGNALDGEFHGRFPSGNGLPGGDFVTLLRSIPSQRALRRRTR